MFYSYRIRTILVTYFVRTHCCILRSVLRSTFAYTHGTWFNLRISCNLMRIYTSKDKIYILHFIPPS